MASTLEIPKIHNAHLAQWVSEMASLCEPETVHWCDGSDTEKAHLEGVAVKMGEITLLDQQKLPGCLYHRSHPGDVARTENLTFICSHHKADAGPTNNWMEPAEAYAKLSHIYSGCMRKKTMYVVPFVMGPPGSKFSKIGVQITDSIYVVLNIRIMAHMGKVALDQLGTGNEFTRCLHSKGDLDIHRRYICHFPEDNTIWSVGSNYGGNALLGKKCLALRIGSYLGKRQQWMAEHMLILGIEDPTGRTRYVAAAFPSQCGKTNLAMLVPPPSFQAKGYKIWTVGDDIAWLHIGPDGRLWGVNPEAGFFGVAPGTNKKTNPNALAATHSNTIFTNVVLAADKTVWWEGLENPPSSGWDWRGDPWTPTKGTKGAHPNSRYTAPIAQCPSVSPQWRNPEGVPISAIIFGGRQAKLAPLVYESLSWQHGVYVGATVASETTSAATGQVGVMRRDPMAMLPFCGYHMADYFGHWLDMGRSMTQPPKIFHVNWFRTNPKGDYLWPGFGENLRVLEWILDRTEQKGAAKETPIGYVPAPGALNVEGLDVSPQYLDYLLSVDKSQWRLEVENQTEFFTQLGERLPREILDEQNALRKRLA